MIFPSRARPTKARCWRADPRANCSVFSSSVSRDRSIPIKQRQIDPVDLGHRFQPVGVDMPDEGIGMVEIRRRQRCRGHPLKRGGDPVDRSVHSVTRASSSSSRIPSSRSFSFALPLDPAHQHDRDLVKAVDHDEQDHLGDHIGRRHKRRPAPGCRQPRICAPPPAPRRTPARPCPSASAAPAAESTGRMPR